MMDYRLSAQAPRFLFAGLLCSCLGSYFGNVFIAAGHGMLLISMGLHLLLWSRERHAGTGPSGEGAGWRQARPRWSTWFLAAMILTILISVFANWREIEEPLKVIKKARYHLIWAGLILTPGVRASFFSRIEAWAPWLVLAWLSSLSLATLSGIIGVATGYNPLLLAPNAFPTRVGGVSNMVMTYAYSLQFSVLLLVALSIGRDDVRQWLGGGRGWLKGLIVGALPLAAAGLYLTYTRGAVMGALAGGLCLVLIQPGIRLRRLVVWGLSLLVLVAGALALDEENRYLSARALSPDRVRLSQWKAAWLTFQKQPVFGVGYRQFEERCLFLKAEFGMPLDTLVPVDGEKVPVYFSGHAHNEYLEALASTGLLGAFALFGFCGFWAWEVSRGKLARHFFLPVVVAFLVSALVQNLFTDSEDLNFLLLLYFLSQAVLDWEEGRQGTS